MSSKSLDRMSSESEERRRSPARTRCWWSPPQLGTTNTDKRSRTKKLGVRRTSSEWTKIRHSLDFIRKSKLIIKQKKSCFVPEEDEETEHSKSLFFLGQVYADMGVEEVELESDSSGKM
jgi:hypothetical protein